MYVCNAKRCVVVCLGRPSEVPRGPPCLHIAMAAVILGCRGSGISCEEAPWGPSTTPFLLSLVQPWQTVYLAGSELLELCFPIMSGLYSSSIARYLQQPSRAGVGALQVGT